MRPRNKSNHGKNPSSICELCLPRSGQALHIYRSRWAMGACSRQKYCALTGSFSLIGAGSLSLKCSLRHHILQGSLTGTLLGVAAVAFGAGAFGSAASCFETRWAAGAFLGALLCMASASGGTLLVREVYSYAADLEASCKAGNESELAGQREYDRLKATLAACRQNYSEAVQVRSCLAGGEQSPWWAILKSAEEKYGCSGFCKDGPPLFSEANVGEPGEPCVEGLVKEARSDASLASSALLGVFVASMFMAFCTAWLCCAPAPLWDDQAGTPEDFQTSDAEHGDFDSEDERRRLLSDSAAKSKGMLSRVPYFNVTTTCHLSAHRDRLRALE
ncbi:unnamed protein product, partial [Effrenium voratum]